MMLLRQCARKAQSSPLVWLTYWILVCNNLLMFDLCLDYCLFLIDVPSLRTMMGSALFYFILGFFELGIIDLSVYHFGLIMP